MSEEFPHPSTSWILVMLCIYIPQKFFLGLEMEILTSYYSETQSQNIVIGYLPFLLRVFAPILASFAEVYLWSYFFLLNTEYHVRQSCIYLQFRVLSSFNFHLVTPYAVNLSYINLHMFFLSCASTLKSKTLTKLGRAWPVNFVMMGYLMKL